MTNGKLVSLQQARNGTPTDHLHQLDHVITVEQVREYTIVKFADGSERVVEPPEVVVSAIQSADERRI